MVMAQSQTGPYVFIASVFSRKDLPKGLKKQTKLSSVKPYRSFQTENGSHFYSSILAFVNPVPYFWFQGYLNFITHD